MRMNGRDDLIYSSFYLSHIRRPLSKRDKVQQIMKRRDAFNTGADQGHDPGLVPALGDEHHGHPATYGRHPSIVKAGKSSSQRSPASSQAFAAKRFDTAKTHRGSRAANRALLDVCVRPEARRCLIVAFVGEGVESFEPGLAARLLQWVKPGKVRRE
jgi:hypothetical protein